MKRRVEAILRLLASADAYTTIEQIAAETDAGVRTIHRDLETLERNLSFRGIRLERRRGHGVRLIDPLPDDLLQKPIAAPVGGAIETQERPLFLFLYLVAAADWVKISELAHVFFVSDSSVSSDLTVLEPMLPPGIKIDRRKGVGVRLTGDELSVRLVFVAAFPSLFPLYTLLAETEGGGRGASTGYRRLIEAMDLVTQRSDVLDCIADAEALLGFAVSPAYTSLLYGYLYLLHRRVSAGRFLTKRPATSFSIPTAYSEAAERILRRCRRSLHEEVPDAEEHERSFLARILASVEVAAPPGDRVSEMVGEILPAVNGIIERTLGALEERERAWLHDDRALLDYLRMTIAAAARRLDLGIPRWRAFLVRPYPSLDETAEGAALNAEFLLEMSPLINDIPPAIARRELDEATFAISARIETLHRRRAAHISVRILCYEGLGMSSYLRALAREILPPGARVDAQWDPDFANSEYAASYDLVVSTYPIDLSGVPQIVVDGDADPESIRAQLRQAVLDVVQAETTPERAESAVVPADDDAPSLSLPAVMGVINGFFVEQRDSSVDIIDQAVQALGDGPGETEPEVLRHDFERRESYGVLVFEELNIRLVHCRTHGVTQPRAGVIQSGSDEPTVLVLAAPVQAPHSETRVLSELVVALTETPDFPRTLAEDDRESVQGALLSLFSRAIG